MECVSSTSDIESLVGGDTGDGAADPTGQLHVLRHDGDALGVDRAQVCVLEEVHDEVFRRLLERKQAFCGPSEGLWCQVISNFPRQTGKRKLSNEEVCRSLVFPDLPQRDGPWPEPFRFHHALGLWLLRVCRARSGGPGTRFRDATAWLCRGLQVESGK